jgi:hypothetical protein
VSAIFELQFPRCYESFDRERGLEMDYEIARARVLLRDLEQIGRGHPHGVQLAASTERGPAVNGTATRLGLLRLAVRLAQAAIEAQSVVVVHDSGAISENTGAADALVQVVLVDDPPMSPPHPAGWADWMLGALVLTVISLSVIGFITVVRWIAR